MVAVYLLLNSIQGVPGASDALVLLCVIGGVSLGIGLLAEHMPSRSLKRLVVTAGAIVGIAMLVIYWPSYPWIWW